MKKIIVGLVVLGFVFSLVSWGSAAEPVRKKVVKIKPAQIEEQEPTPVKTTRIKPKALESSGKPPKAKPISGKGAEGAGARGLYAERGPSGIFVAVKGGFAMPRAMAGLEIGTTFLNNVMDKADLAGRLGVGYLKGFGYTVWSVYGDVLLASDIFRSANCPLTLNLGAGLNYPVSVNENRTGSLGFNVFLGLNYDIIERGQLFVEGSFNTFAIKDQQTRSGGGLLAGFKYFF